MNPKMAGASPLSGDSELRSFDPVADSVLFAVENHRWLCQENERAAECKGARLTATRRNISERIEIEEASAVQVVWLAGHARAEVGSGDKAVELEPGTVWTPTGARGPVMLQAGGSDSRKGSAILGLQFSFSAPRAAGYVNYLARNFSQFVQLPSDSGAQHAVRALARALDAGKSREALSRLIFRWLASLHAVLEEKRLHLSDLLRGDTSRLPSLFAEHGHSIKALSGYLGCSPTYLSQQLKYAWKHPARDVLHALRREHALQLLATTSLNIGEVARHCGFANTSSFATTFKRETGLTPTQARNGQPHLLTSARPSRQRSRRELESKDQATYPADNKVTPVAVWGEAFFQFDGGVSDLVYETPFDLAFNAVTNAVFWVMTLEGRAVFEAGGHTVTVKPGMFIVYPQPMNGRWITPDGNSRPWKRVWLSVRCKWGIDAMLELGEAYGWVGTLPRHSAPVKLAQKWVDYWHIHRNEPSVASSQAGFEWLQCWREHLQLGKAQRLSKEVASALPDLQHLLSKSFWGQIKTITEYANNLGYSRRHVTRKLRAQWTDGTPAQIIRKQKLAQAALDLKHTDLSVAEIARKSNFASPGSFIPAFKREYAMTPLAYRLAQI